MLARLARQGEPTDILARHLALEEAIVGSPLTTGNRQVLLQDGPATYRAMLAEITAAREHTHMETYILDDDEVGQRFAQAIIAKRQQGVAVRLIRDGVGTLGTPAALFAALAASGVEVLEFNPANPLLARKEWDLNQRDHRKLLVVDGQTALLGDQQRVPERLLPYRLACTQRHRRALARHRPAAPAPRWPSGSTSPRRSAPGRRWCASWAARPKNSTA